MLLSLQCVRLLVAFGADTAAAAKPTMLPPLACAAITGRADIVQILLGKAPTKNNSNSSTSCSITLHQLAHKYLL